MKIQHGNFLNVQRGIIVHGCNAIGGFGSGIAKQMGDKWPGVKDGYKRWFTQNPGQARALGDIQVFMGSRVMANVAEVAKPVLQGFKPEVCRELPPDLVVVNAITQFYYGRDPNVRYVDYDAVSAAFSKTAIVARILGLEVNYPAVGAGLANGDWEILSRRIANALTDVESTHWVYQ